MTLAMNETLADPHQTIEEAVEGEIREFVQRDGAILRRTPKTDTEFVANNIMSLLQRIAGTSMTDLDRLIAELDNLREILQKQNARVQRELAEYAHLSQSAIESTKIIAESLAQWRSPHPAPH